MDLKSTTTNDLIANNHPHYHHQHQHQQQQQPPQLPPPIQNRPLHKPPIDSQHSSSSPPPPPIPPPSAASFANRPLPQPPSDSTQPPSTPYPTRVDGNVQVVTANERHPSNIDFTPFSQVKISSEQNRSGQLNRNKTDDLQEISDNLQNMIQERRRSSIRNYEDLACEIHEMSLVYDVAKHDDSKEILVRLITDMFRKATEWSYHLIQDNDPAKQELSQRVHSSEDDDQPEIQQIILSSDEEEEQQQQEDFEETTAPEASTFFEGLPNLLSENELRLFHGFSKNIIKCRVNGTRICDIAQITEATCGCHPDSQKLNRVMIQFAKSMFLQRKYVRRDPRFIKPREISLLSKCKYNLMPCFTYLIFNFVFHLTAGKTHKYYYIPAEKVLVNFVVDDEIINNIQDERVDTVSQYVQTNRMVNCLRLTIYGDDFGFVNPIGVARGNQKLFGMYFDVDNSTHYRTKSHELPLLMIANRKAIKETSMNELLMPLIEDLKKLEKHGLRIPSRGIILKVRLAFVVGDNLGVAELLGFKQCFNQYFICRFCGATDNEIKNESLISEKELNIKKSISLSEALARREFGLSRISKFSELRNINIFALAPPDFFHDLIEGILGTITSNILNGFIVNGSKLRKRELKRKINSMKWVNYPVGIEPNFTILGKAMQKFEFFCRIVEMFPSLMDSQQEVAIAYRNFRHILLSFCSASPVDDHQNLKENLSQAIQASIRNILKECFCWNTNVRTPKAHFITHYYDLRLIYDDLSRHGTARFERVHATIKQLYKHGKNFRNLPGTLALLYQEYILVKKFWFSDPDPPSDCEELQKKWHPFPLEYGIVRAIIADNFFFIMATKFFTRLNKIFVNGNLYKVESENGDFIFGKAIFHGQKEIAYDEISHNNSFIFQHNGESYINYIIKK
ncbi:hypothetical protein DERF_002736 [Dermatophagoides farinae]|uniref:Uncharacterized protein n=1 Tax=Dermatophagoides farinae TaxID=6954 RepID=A0A922LDE1_DERFA|nr:hypothetical protein DERF_002736 [Dermatophagoides farinae]